jgi:hypothetical protein
MSVSDTNVRTLKISVFDGEYFGSLQELTHLCDIEGSVTAYDTERCDVLSEALRVLEMSEERHTAPRLDRCFTVFIGREVAGDMTTLVRLDGFADNGEASASVLSRSYPRWDTVHVMYTPDDDAVEIVRKLIAGQFAP